MPTQTKPKRPPITNIPGSVALYDGEAIEAILSFHTFRTDFKLWRDTVVRFAKILKLFFTIVWMGWWDQQIWSYIGEDDIDFAQSQRRHAHGSYVTEKLLVLGPTFIKVGQSLSTRVDLLRKEYIDELARLQDRVPAFSTDAVRRIIHEELDEPVETLFASFQELPLAAASLGQVHRVTLHNGDEAVVKVQRPDLLRRFRIDLAILRRVAKFLERNTDVGRGREWVSIVDEFGRTLFEEIDYIREGRSADRFRRNFAGAAIRVPKIYWNTTARRVITMEYLPGTKVNDLTALDALGINREKVSITLVRSYFQQLLLDGFFHADPHPGNIVVDDAGNIILYDYGMVGHIAEETRIKMVSTFLNIVNKRTDSILKNLSELEMLTPGADLEEIHTVVSWALDNYYDVPHDQLNFEELADEMAEVMYYYPFKLPASFTFMFRALITLEGVATVMYPEIQFMSIAVDYAKDFVGRTVIFDRLLKPGGAETLVKEGLEFLGLQGPGRTGGASQRVRLYHDEWKPLARYIKAGFFLVAMGQILTLALLSLILLFNTHFAHASTRIILEIALGTGIAFFAMMAFGTLIWMPARRKPILFNPPKTKKHPRN